MREQEQSADTVRRAIAREELGVLERESEQQAAAREDPAVQARELRQWAVAQGKKTHEMACKCINGEYLFHKPCGYGMNPVFTVVGTFIFQIQHLGLGRNVALMAPFFCQ